MFSLSNEIILLIQNLFFLLFQISVDRQTNLSFLGLPAGMLQTYCNLVTKLRETLGSLPSDLVTLIQLAILWRSPQTNLSTREVQPSIAQATGLAERYLFHLTEKLDQSFYQL